MIDRRSLIPTPFAKARRSLPNLYPPGSLLSGGDRLLQECLELISQLSGNAKLFAGALLVTGARPQELLNLRVCDIDSRGMVNIRSLKGSKPRLVHCPLLLSLVPPGEPDQLSLLFRRYSYAKFYRACTGLYRGKAKDSVLHRPLGRLFRSAFATCNLALSAGDLQMVADSLGHRRPDSTLSYINPRR